MASYTSSAREQIDKLLGRPPSAVWVLKSGNPQPLMTIFGIAMGFAIAVLFSNPQLAAIFLLVGLVAFYFGYKNSEIFVLSTDEDQFHLFSASKSRPFKVGEQIKTGNKAGIKVTNKRVQIDEMPLRIVASWTQPESE